MTAGTNGKRKKNGTGKKAAPPERVEVPKEPDPEVPPTESPKPESSSEFTPSERLSLDLAVAEAAALIERNAQLTGQVDLLTRLCEELRHEMQFRRGVCRKAIRIAASALAPGESPIARLSQIVKTLNPITDTLADLIAAPPSIVNFDNVS